MPLEPTLPHPGVSITSWACESSQRPTSVRLTLADDLLVHGDNLEVLPRLPDGAFDLVYIDPPFNTGREQRRRSLRVVADADGDRTGFARAPLSHAARSARWPTTTPSRTTSASSRRDCEHARRLLADHGTLYVHLDPRESHYVKVHLDGLFGRDCFLNEIVWAYDYGAKTRRRWPPKHDTILVYVKDPAATTSTTPRWSAIPYLAPGLVGPEKAARGKRLTDTWCHTIVPTNGREKPATRRRSPRASCGGWWLPRRGPGGWCLDFFAGSGTLGAVGRALGRRFVLVDAHPDAIDVASRRLAGDDHQMLPAPGV